MIHTNKILSNNSLRHNCSRIREKLKDHLNSLIMSFNPFQGVRVENVMKETYDQRLQYLQKKKHKLLSHALTHSQDSQQIFEWGKKRVGIANTNIETTIEFGQYWPQIWKSKYNDKSIQCWGKRPHQHTHNLKHVKNAKHAESWGSSTKIVGIWRRTTRKRHQKRMTSCFYFGRNPSIEVFQHKRSIWNNPFVIKCRK